MIPPHLGALNLYAILPFSLATPEAMRDNESRIRNEGVTDIEWRIVFGGDGAVYRCLYGRKEVSE